MSDLKVNYIIFKTFCFEYVLFLSSAGDYKDNEGPSLFAVFLVVFLVILGGIILIVGVRTCCIIVDNTTPESVWGIESDRDSRDGDRQVPSLSQCNGGVRPGEKAKLLNGRVPSGVIVCPPVNGNSPTAQARTNVDKNEALENNKLYPELVTS